MRCTKGCMHPTKHATPPSTTLCTAQRNDQRLFQHLAYHGLSRLESGRNHPLIVIACTFAVEGIARGKGAEVARTRPAAQTQSIASHGSQGDRTSDSGSTGTVERKGKMYLRRRMGSTRQRKSPTSASRNIRKST